MQDKASVLCNRLGRAVAVAAGLTLAASGAMVAQTIDGVLVARGRGIALAGAFVVAMDSAGSDVQRALTDASGRFRIDLPRPGRYRLRTAMIGWETWTSPELLVAAGERLRYRMEIALHAVALQGIVVHGDRRCRTDPETGRAVTRVWDEARKALAAVSWSQQRAHTYRVERFERELHAASLAIMKEQRTPQRGVSRGSPFVSQPAQVLSTAGYIRPANGEWDFFAPDADVLLSETFASDHCFFLVANVDRPDALGLGFQPVRGRRVPDITGVLWLSRETAELRELEFSYATLPWPVETGVPGGRVEFTQLPAGTWIVPHWSIRMPKVGVSASRHYILSYLEVGGDVAEVRSASGGPLATRRQSRVTGSVFDSTTMRPLTQATVLLLGTSHTAQTDSTGQFALSRVPPGTYRVAFEHPVLTRLGFVPPAAEVTVLPGRDATVSLALPPRAQMRVQLCPDSDGDADVAIVAGFVRWESGEPVAGAAVSIGWEEVTTAPQAAIATQRTRVDIVTDAEGYYLACGVAPDRTISVRAAHGGAQSTTALLVSAAGQIARRDLQLRAP